MINILGQLCSLLGVLLIQSTADSTHDSLECISREHKQPCLRRLCPNGQRSFYILNQRDFSEMVTLCKCPNYFKITITFRL